ncbi:TPA: excalibur calcium-binding domain-containing protein [Bacillus pseudomycoides]|nr:excalibur calcium-binding domain-containing protein [Bacillus pseudomycoides]
MKRSINLDRDGDGIACDK